MPQRFAGLLLVMLIAWIGCRASGGNGSGVVLLRYNPGSESTEQRERGFLETLAKEFPEIHVLSPNQYSGASFEAALDKAQQLLGKYRDSVDGVFAVCEPNATGMLGALDNEGL